MNENEGEDVGEGRSQLRIVFVTGRAGAGRTTAINTLEDIGYETIDTPPLALIDGIVAQLVSDDQSNIAIGVDSRTHGFSRDALSRAIDRLRTRKDLALYGPQAASISVLFLDCADDVLIRRYTETRRRHPLAPAGSIEDGLSRDRLDMSPLRDDADVVIDTSHLSPVELRRALAQRFSPSGRRELSISVLSFSYRRGLPAEADIVLDCRFLQNPHYDDSLRPLDGRDNDVAAFVASDPLYAPFLEHALSLIELLLPAFRREGKSYLTIAFGCTGGRHRSVAVAEEVARRLSVHDRRINLRHRERGGDRSLDARENTTNWPSTGSRHGDAA